MKKYFLLIVLIFTINSPAYAASAENGVKLVDAFPHLKFTMPTGLYNAGDGSNRLFVLEQKGVIRVFENVPTVSSAAVFLDLRSKILSGGELGLLGLAFSPYYKQNGYFYVDYTRKSDDATVIARYKVGSNRNAADPASEEILLTIDQQPFTNHKGGQLAFGPDGYLYIAMGDGGGEGDPKGNAQNRSVLLGKILRIDVDRASDGKNYAIPQDNPFVQNASGYREEIYTYGMRNPWRFSFDGDSLWIADVGQARREEIDLGKKGGNFGWNIMEGSECFSSPSCNQTDLIAPIYDYDRDAGKCVTGGFVYRGSKIPSLRGLYVFGDYVSGTVWTLRYENEKATVTKILDSKLFISSFGIDEQKELYLVSYASGKIMRFEQS